jgi:hypothetical protein
VGHAAERAAEAEARRPPATKRCSRWRGAAPAELLDGDPQLQSSPHAPLRAALLEHYAEALDLSLAG